ncbi:MAG: hypothetical protein LPK45_07590 [Bacteroidota bacterium]|nr:hypothetical protein [Bacteroidota bacterium]MDX5469683.1 hypothetical protein [Bacteroidota bacterium]
MISSLPFSAHKIKSEGEWHFLAVQNGVKFYWREDPTWHFLELKAHNSSASFVNYEYEYQAFEGGRLAHSGKNRWYRLRKDDFNIIKTSREFNGLTQVKLSNLKVEMYR